MKRIIAPLAVVAVLAFGGVAVATNQNNNSDQSFSHPCGKLAVFTHNPHCTPSPTATPSETPTTTPDATPTPSETPVATPSATPTVTPVATPAATPAPARLPSVGGHGTL
jgi:hypothetical protein